MITLFKQEPVSGKRVYRVEPLNSEKGISASLRSNKSNSEYVVCLCLTEKTKKTTFKSYGAALEQLRKYRALYKKLK